jgi:hypothetical protein
MSAAVVAIAIAATFAVALRPVSGTTARNGELVADGAWCWFQDPRALHYVGAHDRTYVGYVTSAGDIDVLSQDAGTAQLTQTVLHPAFQADDHAAPGLLALPDGRIVVFYSGHVGAAMYYRVSVNREDISAFGPEQRVPTATGGVTYANPIYLSAEHRLYLFFRGPDFLPKMTWTSDLTGLTGWSQAVDVVVPDGEPAGTRPRPYVKYATNGIDTIGITFTDGHPREVPTNSVYEMTYRAGVLRAPDGTPISTLDSSAPGYLHEVPVQHDGAMHTDWLRGIPDHGGLVYDDTGTGGHGWIEAMALDSSGAPAIVYSTHVDADHATYHYARWNGAGWTESAIVDAGGTISIDGDEPQYAGGADIDRNDPSTVYLSRDVSPGDGQWEVEQWHTADSGASFDRVDTLTSHSTFKNVRPVVPWGPPGDVQVIWMSGAYAYYQKGYATQLRELTTGPAPTSLRISTSTTRINAGGSVTVSGRVLQGFQGDPVPLASVQLVGHTNGQPDQVIRAGRADYSGLAAFTVAPSATTRYTVRAVPGTTWGAATSPSALVYVARASFVRVSASATVLKRGKPVVVSLRGRDATTGAVLPHATIELWQRLSGSKLWHRVGRYTADSAGLVRVTRYPTVSLAYQARLATSTEHQGAVSPAQSVRVTQPAKR